MTMEVNSLTYFSKREKSTALPSMQVRCIAAVSCHVLFVNGALRDVTIGRSQLTPSPKDVTPAVAHTTLFVLPARSCREGAEHFDPTPLAFFGLASSGRVTPVSPVTLPF